MELKSVEYVEFEGTSKEWRLEGFSPKQINLIVGRNATGKSRMLRLIRALGNLVAGDAKPQFLSGDYKARFDDDGEEVIYRLNYESQKVKREKLEIAGKPLLDRAEGGAGMLYFEETKKDMKFQVPENEIACFARLDNIQHPFLQRLYEWGNLLRYYTFGTFLGQNEVAVPGQPSAELNLKECSHVVAVLRDGMAKSPSKFVQSIIRDMGALGYHIDELSVAEVNGKLMGAIPATVLGITVQEHDLSKELRQLDISAGMFRALSLITQLTYSEMFNRPSCILIDDIGEGLDYERASALITLLIDKTKNTSTQLIMSTNDRFVMNNVPLEFWSVAQRTPNGCRILNSENAGDKFRDFELTGLSNFDFFAGEFFSEGEGDR